MSDTPPNQAPGLLRILAAIFYDSVLVFGIVFFAATIVYVPLELITGDSQLIKPGSFSAFLMFIYLLAAGTGFHLWFWTHGGQTLGMRTWRIKLVTSISDTVSFKQAITRYLAAILSLLVAGLGFLWIIVSPANKSWHDMLSNTQLIKVAKKTS